MGPDRAQLVSELRSLRKGRGLSVEAMASCTAIRGAVGHDDPVMCYRIFEDSLRHLGEAREVRAARNALAIDVVPPGSLTARRTRLAHEEFVSPKTVEAWENKAFEDLADTLLGLSRDQTITAEVHDLYVDEGSIIGYKRAVVYGDAEVEERRAVFFQDQAVERLENLDPDVPSFPFFWYVVLYSDQSPQRVRVNFPGLKPEVVILQVYVDVVHACMQAEPLLERGLPLTLHSLRDPDGKDHHYWQAQTATLSGFKAGNVILVAWAGKDLAGRQYGMVYPAGDASNPQLPLF